MGFRFSLKSVISHLHFSECLTCVSEKDTYHIGMSTWSCLSSHSLPPFPRLLETAGWLWHNDSSMGVSWKLVSGERRGASGKSMEHEMCNEASRNSQWLNYDPSCVSRCQRLHTRQYHCKNLLQRSVLRPQPFLGVRSTAHSKSGFSSNVANRSASFLWLL